MKTLKTFTKVEADELLPQISKQIEALQGLQKKVEWLEVQAEMQLFSGVNTSQGLKLLESLKDQREELFGLMNQGIEEIQSTGCILKDLVFGVVDFCSFFQGKVVYLSWRYGEKEVSYMHFSDEAYENRRLIVEAEKKAD